jgi:thioredoxin-like negative regulator of GroEL
MTRTLRSAIVAGAVFLVGITLSCARPQKEVWYHASDVALLAATGRPQLVEFFHPDWLGCQAMAPVVHGLEKQYAGRIDFLYLNIAEAHNDSAKRAFGFRATPHFFLVNQSGIARDSMQGIVPADSLRAALNRLISVSGTPK